MPIEYSDVLFRRWVVHYFCMNIKVCWVSLYTSFHLATPPQTSLKMPNNSKNPNFTVFQTKDMQTKVEIGQQRSARQFAVDTLNPRWMTTLAFFRVVRKMIVVVSGKLRLRPKTIISAMCMCGSKVQLNIIFAPIHNLCHLWF